MPCGCATGGRFLATKWHRPTAGSPRIGINGVMAGGHRQIPLRYAHNHCERHMPLHFIPAVPPLCDMQIWQASSSEYSFAISREVRRRSEARGKPAFVASWRSRYNTKPAITVVGSPFATFAEAEQACEGMLIHLSRRVI